MDGNLVLFSPPPSRDESETSSRSSLGASRPKPIHHSLHSSSHRCQSGTEAPGGEWDDALPRSEDSHVSIRNNLGSVT